MKYIPAILLFVYSFICAQENSPSILLSAVNKEYLVYEPVYLRIETNLKIPSRLEEENFKLIILKPDGSELKYRPPVRFDDAAEAPAVTYSTLAINRGTLIFDKPGDYELRAVFPCSKCEGTVESNLLTLSFSLPSGPGDWRAMELIEKNKYEYGWAVYIEGGDQLPEGMAIMHELAGFENAYQSIANFVISCNWARSFLNYRTGEIRPIDLEKALQYAEQCTLSTLPTYLRIKNVHKLAWDLRWLKKKGVFVDTELQNAIEQITSKIARDITAEESKEYGCLKAIETGK